MGGWIFGARSSILTGGWRGKRWPVAALGCELRLEVDCIAGVLVALCFMYDYVYMVYWLGVSTYGAMQLIDDLVGRRTCRLEPSCGVGD